jgi:hypothetical protein
MRELARWNNLPGGEGVRKGREVARGSKKKLCMTERESGATIVNMDVTALQCAKDSLCLRKPELANDTSMLCWLYVGNRRPTATQHRFSHSTL